MSSYEKRGYLNSDFRLFHLTDTKAQDIDYHYHDFHKIIIFIRGNVKYLIEGVTYQLKPYDILLVNRDELHKPVIDPAVPYERIIVYLSPAFITSYRTEEYDLSRCFSYAREKKSNVLRINASRKNTLLTKIHALEQACSDREYAGSLLKQLIFLEFMVHLNRAADSSQLEYIIPTTQKDPRILELLSYINSHLTSPLDIQTLSSVCHLSRYHMMHLFKEETGCTIGTYISNKRLMLARDLVMESSQDSPITQICYDCGFQNYSAFSRAYKQFFGQSPREHKKQKNANSNTVSPLLLP